MRAHQTAAKVHTVELIPLAILCVARDSGLQIVRPLESTVCTLATLRTTGRPSPKRYTTSMHQGLLNLGELCQTMSLGQEQWLSMNRSLHATSLTLVATSRLLHRCRDIAPCPRSIPTCVDSLARASSVFRTPCDKIWLQGAAGVDSSQWRTRLQQRHVNSHWKRWPQLRSYRLTKSSRCKCQDQGAD